MSKAELASLRKTPTQLRGQETVERLLDVTGHLLDEHGYETLTTKAIAEAAGASIGSFYQFFPNKDAVILTLVDRYRDKIRQALQASLAVLPPQPTTLSLDWVNLMIDGIARLYDEMPGFAALWSTTPAEPLQQEIIDGLSAGLAASFPNLSAERRNDVLAVAVKAAHALFGEDQAFNMEVRTMIGLYLSACFGNSDLQLPE